MLLRLVVVEGPLKGEEVIIRDAIFIGRKGADLNLLDPKVSSKHAKIFTNDEGVVTIEDLESSNGTYVNDIKVTTWPLKIGDKVAIGKTIMKVEDQPVDQGSEKGTWQEVIEEAFNDALQRANNLPPKTKACEAFQDPVVLEFVRGIQTGASIIFGFGPRSVGKLCTDALLIDTQAPDLAFELHPIKNGLCELRSPSEEILLNGKKFDKPKNKKAKLKIGDRISFGQTVIVVKAFEKL